MARYWWVNHKTTARRMIEGGYLWSPKHIVRKRDGGIINNETYNNMRRVNPDDLIISFSNKKISSVGRATGFAFNSKKPLALAPLATAWGDSGWLLPVAWTALEQQVEPREHIDLIRTLLPTTKNSPMKPDGNGNQNVFLAEISAELFEVLCGLAGFEPALALHAQQIAPTPESMDDEAAQRIVAAPETHTTEAEAVVMARRGQGKFRQNVSQQEGACRLTGIANSELLIASHIKPWRVCEDGERLDGANGLLLTPNADRLFDRGFITFHDDGGVEVSSRLPPDDLGRLGFREGEMTGRRVLQLAKPKVFTPPQRQYLQYHRNQVFLLAV
jgi:putative restriction endonuclease